MDGLKTLTENQLTQDISLKSLRYHFQELTQN